MQLGTLDNVFHHVLARLSLVCWISAWSTLHNYYTICHLRIFRLHSAFFFMPTWCCWSDDLVIATGHRANPNRPTSEQSESGSSQWMSYNLLFALIHLQLYRCHSLVGQTQRRIKLSSWRQCRASWRHVRTVKFSCHLQHMPTHASVHITVRQCLAVDAVTQ